MLSHRLRIIISLAVALLVVNLYGRLSTTPFVKKNLFFNFKFPTLNLWTGQGLSLQNKLNNQNNSFNLPTSKISSFSPTLAPSNKPSATSEVANGLSITPKPTLFSTGFVNKTPTPKPTSKPKPTATPKLPAVTSAQRPGSTLTEIFNEVQKRECIPAALLYAFQTQETGPWWPFDSPSSKVKIYNKYGWWLDGTGSSCTGMGYHTQTGIVPADAVDAGTVCQNALGGYDQAIMGILQINQDEENAAKKYITNVIKGSIDRRVLFDNAVIFAIITKNRLGTPPSNCTDWPDDAVREAAEKHYGSCGDNYCTNILKYYKQYK